MITVMVNPQVIVGRCDSSINKLFKKSALKKKTNFSYLVCFFNDKTLGKEKTLCETILKNLPCGHRHLSKACDKDCR